MVNIEEMLRSAVYNSAVYCPYCHNGEYEPDYKKCLECDKVNPLRKEGLI